MTSNLFVGNLSYEVCSGALNALFGSHGTVQSARVVVDRNTGRSKGFGFVEMSTGSEADAAMAALHGADFEGRLITVNQAKSRENPPTRQPERLW